MKKFFLSFLNAKYRACYGELMRLDKPIGSYLLWVPCLWGLSAAFVTLPTPNINHALLFICLFAIGSLLMRGAGCTINDYFDRDLDKHVERTKKRPLASERLPAKYALYFFICLCAVSSLILFFLPLTAIIISFLSLIPVILYPLMKRITYWPQIFLGLVFNMGILIGYSALNIHIDMNILWLYAAGVFHTLGYDSIYAFQDIEDDMKIGVKSSAQKIQRHPKIWITLFYSLMITMLTGYYITIDAEPYHYSGMLCLWLYLLYQIYDWKPNSAENSLKYFKNAHYNNIIVTFLILLLYIK